MEDDDEPVSYSGLDHRAERKPFWEASPHTGRKPHYDDPEKLRADALEYMQWVFENPFFEHKTVGGEGMIVRVPKMRPATLGGLQIFLGMSPQSWSDYRKKPLFSEVIGEIDEMIREQKFAGAAAGFLNANIIARDLGLADKREVQAKATVLVRDSFDDEEEGEKDDG